MTKDGKPFVLIGAGGHGRVVLNMLLDLGHRVLFATDANEAAHGTTIMGVPVTGGDEAISNQAQDEVVLAMGLGIAGADRVAAARTRMALAERLAAQGYTFPALIHPSAVVGRECDIGTGAQIMAGAVLQPNTRIGDHAIVNTGASVDHDAAVGAGSHVGPGATVCGRVTIGAATFIGAGATVVNDVTLGDGVFVTAGSLIARDAEKPGKYRGQPARLQDGPA